MKAMTITQVKHLEKRTHDIVVRAVRAFESTLPESAKLLTLEQKLTAIRTGKAKLRPTVGEYTHLPNAFTYAEETKAIAANEAREKKVNAYRAELEKQRRQVLDRAVLGDANAALSALESFEAAIGKGK